MKTNAELRAAARTHLGGGLFANNWMLGLVVMVIAGIISGILSSFAIGLLVMGPLTVGIAAFFLPLARGEENGDIAGMCYAVKTSDRFMNTLILGILTWLFTFLWSLLFIIPGIVKGYAYALAPYIAIEREDLDARECIAESERLMDGHKWQLFLLDLSFIGWMIVGLACCCIGIYFVAPYRAAAHAEFYCALVGAPAVVADVQAEDITEDETPDDRSDDEVTK